MTGYIVSEEKLQIVTEGKAKIFAYTLPSRNGEGISEQENLDKWELKDVPTRGMPVFYNPAMVQNRNISVMAVHAWKDKPKGEMNVADAMCGGGIRGIRYLLEAGIDGLHVDFVDLNPAATRTCKKNVDLNGIDSSSYEIYTQDANAFLFSKGVVEENRYAIVDVDPFGNPMHYITGGLKALRHDHGMLHVNATDLAVLAGVQLKATLRKYQARPLRHVAYHAEVAARILLGAIFRKAMEIDCTIKPLLTIAKNHFVKVILEKIHDIESANKDLENRMGYMVHCRECEEHFTALPGDIHDATCPACNSSHVESGGPLWLGDIQDRDFCMDLRSTFGEFSYMRGQKGLGKIIENCAGEARFPPGSHDIHEIARSLTVSSVSLESIIEDLKNQGYNAARAALNPIAIKTTASRKLVSDVIAARATI
ncbi:MAG TPA: hypothetical protein VKM55_14140 [Candidatus Lokiarchaeia archaeon]|nr:hypothetical protein [Candidatus Lokiarchaeia archaeon]